MKYKSKRGIQLNEAAGAVLMIVLVAVLVIVSMVLFTNLGTSLDQSTTAVNVNESITALTVGTNLSAINLPDGSCAAGVVAVWGNATEIVTISSGNYTQTNCQIANTTSTYSYGTAPKWNITYTYTYSAPTAATNASSTSITQFAGYPALIGLVGTIVFLGIVIGVLVASFAFGSNKA